MSRFASYAQIGGADGLLARTQPFSGSSMSARWLHGDYVVTSYHTEIARVISDGQGGLIDRDIPDRYYSPTTSRHQNLCWAWLPNPTHKERTFA